MEPSSLPLTVLNALPHPVFMVCEQGTLDFVNSAGEAFFQSSASLLKDKELSWFLPQDSPMSLLIKQVQEMGAPVSEYKVKVFSPRLGQALIIDVYGAPAAEKKGGVVVLLQVRSMADTLDKQLTHRGAARTVTGLAAMLAHEIKNPLSGIRGAAQLLEMNSNDEERLLTRLITDETDRIVRLVDRMEVFSDESPLKREAINVHAVLDHVRKVAQSGFAKDIKIIENYDPSLPAVLGNRDQLIQVFLNLVKNASEALASTKEAEITLTTAYRTGMKVAVQGTQERVSLPIALMVTDNGPGIPEDIQAHMFDPFVSSKQNGSGLGLALVAKIIGDHGGVISYSRDQQQTVFQVLMPLWVEGKDDAIKDERFNHGKADG